MNSSNIGDLHNMTNKLKKQINEQDNNNILLKLDEQSKNINKLMLEVEEQHIYNKVLFTTVSIVIIINCILNMKK
jgi:hypothetical protein